MNPEREALERLVEALAERFGAPWRAGCAASCLMWWQTSSVLTRCTCGAEQLAAAWGHAENLINNDEEEQ